LYGYRIEATWKEGGKKLHLCSEQGEGAAKSRKALKTIFDSHCVAFVPLRTEY